MTELDSLKNLVLAPYILKATALIGVQRQVGGNQFRHCFSTLGILLDYKFFSDSVLLKASLLHDLLEDLPETQVDEIRSIDNEGHQVVALVLEVTKRKDEIKDPISAAGTRIWFQECIVAQMCRQDQQSY